MSRVSRRHFIAGSAGTVLTASIGTRSQSRRSERPNILFILADDMGWGDLGSQGHPYARTPAIDRLAASGARFTQFYVTAPICSASRKLDRSEWRQLIDWVLVWGPSEHGLDIPPPESQIGKDLTERYHRATHED